MSCAESHQRLRPFCGRRGPHQGGDRVSASCIHPCAKGSPALPSWAPSAQVGSWPRQPGLFRLHCRSSRTCSSEPTRRRRTTLVATNPQAATLPPRCQPTCSNRFPTSRRLSVPRRRVHLPDPASGQPDVRAETDALAPAATDTYSTASQPETAAAHAPSTPPESPGGPPAGVEPKGGPPESPGGPPAGVEPKGGPPESPGEPPAGVEPRGAPPESPDGPPAAAVDLSQAPTGTVEQPGEE